MHIVSRGTQANVTIENPVECSTAVTKCAKCLYATVPKQTEKEIENKSPTHV